MSKTGLAESYDPYWNPINLGKRTFKTLLCTYVFNVISKNKEGPLIKKIKSLLEPEGIAYITVRRDIKKDKVTTKGIQRVVGLNLKVIKEDSSFCIYELRKN